MVESASLENWYVACGIGGSNPPLSASGTPPAALRSIKTAMQVETVPACLLGAMRRKRHDGRSAERCQSGLMGTPGKRVWSNPPQVRILSSPPFFNLLRHRLFHFGMTQFRPVTGSSVMLAHRTTQVTPARDSVEPHKPTIKARTGRTK